MIRSFIIVAVLLDIFLFAFLSMPLYSQKDNSVKGSNLGVFSSTSMSYAGYATAIGVCTGNTHSKLLIGLNTSLSDLAYFGQVRPGANIGYRFYPGETKRNLQLYLGPCIQMTILKKYQNLTGKTSNTLIEAFWEYGMEWNISPYFSVGNAIGFGGYYETYSNPGIVNMGNNHGLNARISLNLTFKLNRSDMGK